MDSHAVTALLRRMGEGDREAAEDLFSHLYEDLRHRAEHLMAGKGAVHTLQPTAIVNEAWLKLASADGIDWHDRDHFFATAARAMRMVLVDHARARAAQKRGGDRERQVLDDALVAFEERAYDLVDLDDGLRRLADLDVDLPRIVELRFFGGLTIEDTARVLGTSESTVERGWRTARAWLRAELTR